MRMWICNEYQTSAYGVETPVNVGSASGDGASSVSSASRGRSRSSARKPQRKGMSLGFDDVEEEEEEDPLAGLEGLEDPTEVGKKKKRFFGLF